ncbi:MAG: biotin/lipoyl-binding protein [Clostridia bacterium]|nr:biotin/lipoyl-binding protein [Clostridia bacterium]MBO7151607.1 biotin/lipoyl-binding protein [Clostridia bacterium]MBO7222337.1 biotin/lipoyl-binding protein [Clostridia bacterium]MBO7326186.1 biotin/lipoyl-binding protein [Clostridia bacterium]
MIYKVTLNGKIYEVEVEQGEAVIQAEYEAALPVATPVVADAPVASAPQASAPVAAPVGGGEPVKSPFPGNVNAVKVTVGQQVKEGEVLAIVEAMKMENEITAPKAGKIGQVLVQKGATVETGAVLVTII